MPSVLITGSNRGLGLEWVKQLAADGWQVIATCRNPAASDELRALAERNPAIAVRRLDVTREDHIREVAGELPALDVLLNNAGVYFEKFNADGVGDMRYGDWEETFRTNTLGPVRMAEAFVPQLARSDMGRVVTITSHMGSIADISSGGSYAYRSSKAALNAAMRGLAAELRPRGIGVLLLHPGWVRTRMGGPGAPITTEQSVQGMRRLIERFRLTDTGTFHRFDGTPMPWYGWRGAALRIGCRSSGRNRW